MKNKRQQPGPKQWVPSVNNNNTDDDDDDDDDDGNNSLLVTFPISGSSFTIQT